MSSLLSPTPVEPTSVSATPPVPSANATDLVNSATFDVAAAQLPPPFDPADEYRQLLESVAEGNGSRRRASNDRPILMDPYQHLLSRERRVLDTVDRVVNDSIAKKEADTSTLLGQPVHVVAMRTAGAVRALLDDLTASRSLDDLRLALVEPLRRPYLGVALVAIAVMMGMLELASA